MLNKIIQDFDYYSTATQIVAMVLIALSLIPISIVFCIVFVVMILSGLILLVFGGFWLLCVEIIDFVKIKKLDK